MARDLPSGLKATEVTSCQCPGTRGGVNAPIRLYNGEVADNGGMADDDGAADDLGRGALVSAGTAKTLIIAAAASKTAPTSMIMPYRRRRGRAGSRPLAALFPWVIRGGLPVTVVPRNWDGPVPATGAAGPGAGA